MPIEPNDLIDNRQLLNFLTLAETRSYTETARKLGLTQSAISHSIKALETTLGLPLFIRSGKTIQLSDTGKAIKADAVEILKRVSSIRNRCRELSEWGHGRLRVAMGFSPCQYLIPEVLREYRRSFPQIEIHIQPADSPSCIRALRIGEVDVAIAVEPREALPDLTLNPLFEDDLKLAVAAYHPWAESTPAPEALARFPCLLHSIRSQTGQMILDALQGSGVTPAHIIELGSYGAIHQMVAANIGYSFLPEWTLQPEILRGTIATRLMPSMPLRRRWVYATRNERQLSLHEETFLGLCTEARDRITGKDRTLFS